MVGESKVAREPHDARDGEREREVSDITRREHARDHEQAENPAGRSQHARDERIVRRAERTRRTHDD